MIKTVILKSGLEIVAEVEETLTGVTLKKPLKIEVAFLPQHTERGIAITAAPNMVPLLTTSIQDSIFVSREDMLCPPLDTSQSVSSRYFKQTTGFEIASAGGLA